MSIDERTLRDTRTELVGGVADMHRQAGKLPDTRAIEHFVDPILNKVDQTSDARTAAPAPKPIDRTLVDGEWYGQEGHSPLVGERLAKSDGSKARLETKVLGEYAIRGDRVVPLNGAPTAPYRMGRREQFERWVVEQLMHHPDFKRRLQAVAFSTMQWCRRCQPLAYQCCDRQKAYGKILADAYRLFGDARNTYLNAPTKKIIVSGK